MEKKKRSHDCCTVGHHWMIGRGREDRENNNIDEETIKQDPMDTIKCACCVVAELTNKELKEKQDTFPTIDWQQRRQEMRRRPRKKGAGRSRWEREKSERKRLCVTCVIISTFIRDARWFIFSLANNHRTNETRIRSLSLSRSLESFTSLTWLCLARNVRHVVPVHLTRTR